MEPKKDTESPTPASFPESKPPLPRLQVEYVSNAEGRIIDVAFSRGGKRATLKDVLPGNYTIIFAPQNPFGDLPHARLDGNIVFPTEAKESMSSFELITALLHEAGHMLDYQKDRDIYKKLSERKEKARVEAIIGRLRLTMSDDFFDPLKFQAELKKQDLEAASLGMPMRVKVSGESESSYRERVNGLIDSAWKYLSDESLTREDIEMYVDTRKETADDAELQVVATQERAAWAYALGAVRKLREGGIISCSNEELLRMVQEPLHSYDLTFEPIVTRFKYVPGVQPARNGAGFVRKRVAIA